MGKLSRLKEGLERAAKTLADYKTRVVYHGSPHDFDAFDLSKIGTGEGAQAYGHGLYFTESDDIAKYYRENLSKGKNAWRSAPAGDVDPLAVQVAANYQELYGKQAAAKLRSELESTGFDFENSTSMAHYRDALRQLEAGNEADVGRIYRAEIPTSDYMLDWDKPLSEQPESVRRALAEIDPDLYSPDGDDYDPMEQGQVIIQRLAQMAGGQQQASELLKSKGIVGINYIGDSSGVRNAVVFDDKLVKILEKGNADPRLLAALGITAGGVAMAMPQDAEAGVTDDVVRAVAKAGDLDMSQAARMARAAEQGFDYITPWYHQTSPEAADSILSAGFDVSRVGARASDELMPDGVFLKSSDADIRVGSTSPVQMDLRSGAQNTARFRNRAELEQWASQNAPEWLENKANLDDFNREKKAEFERLWNDRSLNGAKVDPASRKHPHSERLKKFVDEWSAEADRKAGEGRRLVTDALRREGYDSLYLSDDAGAGVFGGKKPDTDALVVFDPARIRSPNAKFDPANIGKNDLLGAADPRILAPTAAAAAGAGILAADPAAAFDYGAPHTLPGLPSLPPEYNEFARRRASKRGLWDQVKEAAQATATVGSSVGSAVAGAIAGDLSRVGGYINPFMSVEATEAGATGVEDLVRGWIPQYVPSQPNRYLEGLGGFIEGAERDVQPLIKAWPQSIPGRAYNALPERVQGLLRIGTDWLL